MYTAEKKMSAATAASADVAVAALWNPHSTQRIKVLRFTYFNLTAPGAGSGLKVRRITTRGTAGATTTPGIANHSIRGIAPPSGALLDVALYTVAPTFDGDNMTPSWIAPAVAAAGFVYNCNYEIGPGTGLALVTSEAVIFQVGHFGVEWLEDWV